MTGKKGTSGKTKLNSSDHFILPERQKYGNPVCKTGQKTQKNYALKG